MNNPGSSLKSFVDDVQEGFECCGTHGPEGYGYRQSADLNIPVVFPPSCCRRSSRFKGESKACVIHGVKLEQDSSKSSEHFLDVSINRHGCLELAREYFQQLHRSKFLLQWVAVIAFVMSILSIVCLIKIWKRRRRLLSQYPFLNPHQSRRLSNIDEVVKYLKLKASEANGVSPNRKP